MAIVDRIAACVEAAGGIFGGLWETPMGSYAMVTEPVSLSSTLAPTDGISVATVQRALAEVRHRFGRA
jgi:hypothetical protein